MSCDIIDIIVSILSIMLVAIATILVRQVNTFNVRSKIASVVPTGDCDDMSLIFKSAIDALDQSHEY